MPVMYENECISDSLIEKELKEFPNFNSNQIYFYDDVDRSSIYTFNKNLDLVTKNLLTINLNYNLLTTPVVDLFISSDGGEIYSAFSAVDRIKSNKIPVHSYVEGIVASAATFLSIVAHKRFIRRNSYMLIHQLSTEMWGNFQQMKDEMENLENLMISIKNIYLNHTKFTSNELDNILKHDLYLNADQCLEKGLVDFIV
jgi:hypothetical protein